MVAEFLKRGWVHFAPDPALREWARAAHRVAVERVQDPAEQAQWLDCEGTWFVGVDTLPNDATGNFGAGPVTGLGYGELCRLYGELPLHRGQVSVVYPGYPRPRAGENEAGFRYRQRRDAAHVDGLLAVGADRRRMLKERHAYILGLPLNRAMPEASPLVVWEGSHEIMRAAFAEALDGVAPDNWAEVDLTEVYTATRRVVFETCRRIEVSAAPGEAYAVHRLALHGVAPWREGAEAPPEGRMIAYFRPEFVGEKEAWLTAP